MHNYVLKYWAVPVANVKPPKDTVQPDGTVVSRTWDDLAVGFMDWDLLASFITEVKTAAGEPALGKVTEPPARAGAPTVISEPFVYGPTDDRMTAWNHYAIAPDGAKCLLGRKPRRVGDCYCLLDCESTAVAELAPPKENIEKGYKCETCKRWAYRQGQDHITQVTHQFDGGAKGHMWVDVAHMTAANHDVEAPDTLQTFGLCLKHKRLTHSYFPGCDQYAAVSAWTPRMSPQLDPSKEIKPVTHPEQAGD